MSTKFTDILTHLDVNARVTVSSISKRHGAVAFLQERREVLSQVPAEIADKEVVRIKGNRICFERVNVDQNRAERLIVATRIVEACR